MSAQHRPSFERHTWEHTTDAGFVERQPNGYMTVTCTCGLNTGSVPEDEGRRVFEDHRDLPDGWELTNA